jgi:hypothetical protein
MKQDLKVLLEKLDVALRRAAPAKADALAAGAKKAALAKLGKVAKDAPELAVWFAWHDGQTSRASLSPEDNRYLLSIEDALDAAKFLAEEASGWKKSWFPLFANGGGDYVVYETAAGKSKGALVAYWHDEEGRVVEHASLSAWAEQATCALDALPAAKKPKKPAEPDYAKLELALDGAWSPAPKPTVTTAKSAPVGTMFRCEHMAMIAGGSPPSLHVYLKVAAGTWLCVQCSMDVATVLEGVMTRLRAPPKKWGRVYQSLDDKEFVDRLTKKSMSRWLKQDGEWSVVKHDELFTARVAIS